MNPIILAIAATVLVVGGGPSVPKRTYAVKAEFRKLYPCPSTGSYKGPCVGWEIDHRVALVCGGENTVDNLQWLTVEEHKEKTRVEVKLCRQRTKPP